MIIKELRSICINENIKKMVTYLANEQNFSLNKPTEPKILLHELPRIRQTIIYEEEKVFRHWQPLITRNLFVDSALNLAYDLALRL